MTPTFFVGHVSASLRNQNTNSSCWFEAVTFEIELGSKDCKPNGSVLDRSGFCPFPKCQARDHVAAAGSKQMRSNQPDRMRSRRLIRDRILLSVHRLVENAVDQLARPAVTLLCSVVDSNLPITQPHGESWEKPAIHDKILHDASRRWKAASPDDHVSRHPLRSEPSTDNRHREHTLCHNWRNYDAACNSVLYKICFGTGSKNQVSFCCACGEPCTQLF